MVAMIWGIGPAVFSIVLGVIAIAIFLTTNVFTPDITTDLLIAGPFVFLQLVAVVTVMYLERGHPRRIQKYSVKTAMWLFVRDPKKLDESEREDLAAYCQASTALKKAYNLLQAFLSMVHTREGQRLETWLARVVESGLPELQSFAAGIEKDKDAVRAGLTWSINNGMVEGHVTKLKLIKRTMYGRAGFALLRQRVLHAL
ncbi:hypothetical protein KSB_67060 [Ktedonobacter robiniae]|uniref:Transposase IS204/IS1001/IS1096/IS1165 DDE domain-containing protein n=1 Tax=Ktedonobacter robiniae TaxID=2778365 RepID=A0ABQ3UZS9_9CHLR|nr:hypothetical protein KSB_67060 [Ktedonobacter robiniae]